MFVVLFLQRLLLVIAIRGDGWWWTVAAVVEATNTDTTDTAIAQTTPPRITLRIYTAEHDTSLLLPQQRSDMNKDQQVPHQSSLLHAQCVLPTTEQQRSLIGPNDTNHDTEFAIQMKEVCCRAILDQLSTINNITINTTPDMQRCGNDIIHASFDVNPYGSDPNAIAKTTTIYSWVTDITPQNNITMMTTSTTILSPPPYHIHQSSLSLYDFLEDHNIHRDLASYDTHTTIRHSKQQWTINVHLQSTLSASGGMHRTMDHILHVQSSDHASLQSPQSKSTNVTLNMLFHLPSHLFINIEDCFQYDKKTNTESVTLLSLHVVPPSLPHLLNIDQEEPEFVSPAHVVLVQIQLLVQRRNRRATNDSLWDHIPSTIRFSTKLHIRYPKPFSLYEYHHLDSTNPYHTPETFRHIWMVPPILTNGHETNHRNIETDVIVTIQNDAHQPSSLLQLWIASGHQSHFTITIVVTIALAMIGSMMMLYDLSTIAKWR